MRLESWVSYQNGTLTQSWGKLCTPFWSALEQHNQSNSGVWLTLTSDFPTVQGATQNSHGHITHPRLRGQHNAESRSLTNPPHSHHINIVIWPSKTEKEHDVGDVHKYTSKQHVSYCLTLSLHTTICLHYLPVFLPPNLSKNHFH